MKKINLLILLSVLTASVLAFFTGCETMGPVDNVNDEINESVEMEEYILAGLDLQHSLNQFKEELKGIDMLALMPTLDSKGKLVINLPTKISIEKKSKDFNTKKKVLLDKYPELKNMKAGKRHNHIRETVDNSLMITKAIIEFELSNQPRLRSGPAEVGNYDSEADAFTFLDQQLASPNYVEVVLVVFKDGTAITYIKDDFTATSCYYPTLKKIDGEWYLTTSLYPQPIEYIGHTHQSNPLPSTEDLEVGGYIGLMQVIYFSGTTYGYYTF